MRAACENGSGKLIIPFCTSGGSDIEEIMPTFLDFCEGLAVYGQRRIRGSSQIGNWLSELVLNLLLDIPLQMSFVATSINCSKGSITGEFMGMAKAREVSDEYSRIRKAFHAQAWLYGTVTTKEFTQYRKPELDAAAKEVPEGDFIADRSTNFYYVSVDTAGEISWESGKFRKNGRPDAHVIEILTEQTNAAWVSRPGIRRYTGIHSWMAVPCRMMLRI